MQEGGDRASRLAEGFAPWPVLWDVLEFARHKLGSAVGAHGEQAGVQVLCRGGEGGDVRQVGLLQHAWEAEAAHARGEGSPSQEGGRCGIIGGVSGETKNVQEGVSY